MSDDGLSARERRARRNREALVRAASRRFATADGVTLDAIARDAGLGIATLYRHFPTREQLVMAVYRDQVADLDAAAGRLLAETPADPVAAFRAWMDVLADWAAVKHGMHDALRALLAEGALEPAELRGELVSIVDRFLVAGAAAGTMRDDARAEDVAVLLAGVLAVAGAPDHRAQAERVFGLVVDAISRRPGSRSAGSP